MEPPDLLRDFYLLRGAEPDDLAAVTALSTRRKYQAGDTVFRRGDPADAMFFLRLGTVEVQGLDDDTVVTTIGSGGEFGEIAFFDGNVRSATIQAREVSELVVVPFEPFRKLLEERTRLALVVYRNATVFLARCLRARSDDLTMVRQLTLRRI